MRNIIGSLLIVCSVLGIGIGVVSGKITPAATGTPSPESTPICSTMFTGTVRDAITKAGIGGAVIMVDGVYRTETDIRGDYVVLDQSIGEYQVRATAVGYIPSEVKSVTVTCGYIEIVDFELEPVVIQETPSPVPTPIFLCTEPKAIEVSMDKLKLTKKQSYDITVIVMCENGSPVEEEEVTAVVRGKGRRVVKITPGAVTDASGTAMFTIEAKNRVGRARVTFKVDNLKKSIIVKVKK